MSAGRPETAAGVANVRSLVARVAVVAWFGGMLVIGAALLAKHVVALPAPVGNEKLARSLSALRLPGDRGKWLAVHVLYAECRCSQRVVTHLLSTTRPRGWEEMVLWFGRGEPDPALDAHFRVSRVTAADLSRFGIDAAPLLVVLDPQDRIAYSGGYSERKQGPVLDDLRIFDGAQHAGTLAGLPVFGCAVSDELGQQLSIFPGL
jgi:hypothetical protein